MRKKTTMGQSCPADWIEKKKKFINFVKKLKMEKNFNLLQLINKDKILLTFDWPFNRIVTSVGDKGISSYET